MTVMAPPRTTVGCSRSMLELMAANSSEYPHSHPAGFPPRPHTPEQAHTAGLHIPHPKSTPMKIRLYSTAHFSSSSKLRNPTYVEMGTEMKHYVVGPMPPEAFLDAFLPTDRLPDFGDVPFQVNHYHETVAAKNEVGSYAPFVGSSMVFLPDFRIVNTSTSEDSNPTINFPMRIKPDVSVYHKDASPEPRMDSSLVEVIIEIKWHDEDDPFCDKPSVKRTEDGSRKVPSFIHHTKRANDTLGQISTYAAAQLGSQFRTHAFSVLIVKKLARILRWDRSGVISTEAFNYNELPFLAQFFQRYSRAPRDMRGIDESVSKPTAEESSVASKMLGLDPEVPLFKLEINTISGASSYYITTAPKAPLYAPPGRATRGFHAYDVQKGVLCFVKDTWRVDITDIQEEGITYETLQRNRVRNIPECVAFGNILSEMYHSTKTLDYSKQKWAHPTGSQLIPHRHYRLALNIIGRNLTEFKSTYEMVEAVRDAVIAHSDAFLYAEVLHRDLSPGNIMIGPDNKGLLIDWDLSTPLRRPNIPRRATRTGTWQFLSGKLITGRDHIHDFQDDLESTLYILLWVALMFSKCSDTVQASGFMNNVLDPQPTAVPYTVKPDFLKGRQIFMDLNFVDRPCFDNLTKQLAKLFSYRYLDEPTEQDRAPEMIMRQMLDEPNPRKGLQEAYDECLTVKYDQYTRFLRDHQKTIELFDEALENRSLWPEDDAAKLQEIFGKVTPQCVPKTTSVTLGNTDDMDSGHPGPDAMNVQYTGLHELSGDS